MYSHVKGVVYQHSLQRIVFNHGKVCVIRDYRHIPMFHFVICIISVLTKLFLPVEVKHFWVGNMFIAPSSYHEGDETLSSDLINQVFILNKKWGFTMCNVLYYTYICAFRKTHFEIIYNEQMTILKLCCHPSCALHLGWGSMGVIMIFIRDLTNDE